MSGSRVNIRPGVSVLSVLRHLNYKPWFAMAEFVDNAIQSGVATSKPLRTLHGEGWRLRVAIDIDASLPGRIVVRDNAAGIDLKTFPRAFRPAVAPPDRTGLSEFGMGMKSAACWFASKWQVRTKALGESIERTVRFDIAHIVRDDLEELEIEERPAPIDAHYTELVLEGLHTIPVGRTLGKIKEHLADIYRVFVRDGSLELKFNGELLEFHPFPVLRAPYYREPTGPEITWRKEIGFDLGDGLVVKGFAALLDPGNYARSGFALFRRGRLIEGSGEAIDRPSSSAVPEETASPRCDFSVNSIWMAFKLATRKTAFAGTRTNSPF
jgi:Histidine kinase-, DNA gyrase B-, and HSP90-like ATPase